MEQQPNMNNSGAGNSTPTAQSGLKPNTAALLSYLLGYITGIIFLIISKDKYVRFHAMQSTITFISLNVIQWIIGYMFPFFYMIVSIISLVLWVVLMYKAYHMEKFKLPVIGDLAEKWTA